MLKRARGMSREQCLDMERQVVMKLLHDGELFEGIRGSVMNPEKPPKFGPARDVSEFLDDDF
jgi:hypothetical protein